MIKIILQLTTKIRFLDGLTLISVILDGRIDVENAATIALTQISWVELHVIGLHVKRFACDRVACDRVQRLLIKG